MIISFYIVIITEELVWIAFIILFVSMHHISLNYSLGEGHPSISRDPHKFPKYKIKNTSNSKSTLQHKRARSNLHSQTSLTFKHISPTFSKHTKDQNMSPS